MKDYPILLTAIICFDLAASPFAYVTNYGADSISVVDLATNAATGYVDNRGFNITNPVDVRHSPDGTKAYLLADFNNALFVIDTSINAIVSQMDSSQYAFMAPNVVSFTPDGTKAYVSNQGGNNISIIDVVTDTITGYVKDPNRTFFFPAGIAFSPDGTLAYIANYNGGTVSIIDVASDSVRGVVDNGAFFLNQPSYVNFIDNSKAYVTVLNSAQVGIIDVASAALTGFVNSGSHSFVSPFAILATSDGANEILIDPGAQQAFTWASSTDTVANAVSGFDYPIFFAISADNSTAYVTDLGANAVYIVDLSAYTITGSFDGSIFPFTAPFSISISP